MKFSEIVRCLVPKSLVVIFFSTLASIGLSQSVWAAAPTITSVVGSAGSAAGGDSVTITGTNFTAGSMVRFDEAEATSIVVVNTTTITATTPAGQAGVADVRITNTANESGMLAGGYIYTDTAHAINTWTGDLSIDWDVAENWSAARVPTDTDIVVINGGLNHPTLTLTTSRAVYGMLLGSSTSSTLTVAGGSDDRQLVFANDLAIGGFGVLTHAVNGVAVDSRLFVAAEKITVNTGGKIDVSGKGYKGGGPGFGNPSSHGGDGVQPAYGSIRQPVDLGSANTGTVTYSVGGGSVKLTANNLVNNGTITANGVSSGSGGSVWLSVSDSLTGSGSITANYSVYGSSAYYSTGGRVAVYAQVNNYSGIITASGGSGSRAAGTVYTQFDNQQNGDLLIANPSTATTYCTPEMDTNATYDTLTVTGGARYCIKAGQTVNVSKQLNAAAGSTATTMGTIVVDGRLNVPDSTELINLYVYLNNNAGYLDQNPIIGNGSTVELTATDARDDLKSWQVNSLTIKNGGNLTHSANGSTYVQSVNIRANSSITIEAGGKIDVTAKGFKTGSPGNGNPAAYGGDGAQPAYGSIRQPTDLGSINSVGTTYYSGGAVKLTTDNLRVDGSILATGSTYTTGGSIWLTVAGEFSGVGNVSADGVAWSGYRGSGGRVAVYSTISNYAGKLSAVSATDAPAGTVYTKFSDQVNGDLLVAKNNSTTTYCTPEMDTNATYDTLTVTGGARYCIKAGQTVSVGKLSPSSAPASSIVVDGQFNIPDSTELINLYVYMNNHNGYSDQNPIIGSGSTVELTATDARDDLKSWQVNSLTIKSGGNLTHPANDLNYTRSVNLKAIASVSIEAGGKIDVTAKGFKVGSPGNGNPAAYGGDGTKPAYGSIRQPTDLGSINSGATTYYSGGAVKLTTGNLRVDGSILSNNTYYTTGGSIWLTAAGEFTGSGVVSANGGNYSSFTGSGGRIAIYSGTSSYTGTTSTSSPGVAAAGTIYTKTGDQAHGDLLIDKGNIAAATYCTPEMDTDVQYDNLTVTGGARYCIKNGQTVSVGKMGSAAGSAVATRGTVIVDGRLNVPDSTELINLYTYLNNNNGYSDQNPIIGSGSTVEHKMINNLSPWTLQSLTIRNNGTLTTPANDSTTHDHSVYIESSGPVNIESGGRILADNLGYLGGNGPGLATNHLGGGGYGGRGAVPGVNGGSIYGDRFQPTDLGAGGGVLSNGVRGGGAIRINSNDVVTINGSLSANGQVSSGYGNGSGGSIWISSSSLLGSGSITADGASYSQSSNYANNAGGGGRIAIDYTDELTLDSLSSNQGSQSGGDIINLSGVGFGTNARVYFDEVEVPSADITLVNSTSLRVRVPASTVLGLVDVRIDQPTFAGTITAKAGSTVAEDGTIEPYNGAQTYVLTDSYTYLSAPPTIDSLTPNNGPETGGQTVSLKGKNLYPTTRVFIGTIEIDTVEYISETELRLILPVGTGQQNIRILNTDTQEATLVGGYTYNPAPTINEVSLNMGPLAGGNTVTISGSGFLAGSTVRFGAGNLTDVNVVNSTTITGVVPAVSTAQTVDVTVILPDTQIATRAAGYTYNATPSISSVLPSSGPTAGAQVVTIKGSRLLDGSRVRFGDLEATNVRFVSTNQLTAVTPAQLEGVVSVTVLSPDGQTTQRANAYTYLAPPTITGFTPLNGKLAGGYNMTIAGTNLDASIKVLINDIEATVVSRSGTTGITVRVPAGTLGEKVVKIVTNAGEVMAVDKFIYTPDAYTFVSEPLKLHATEAGHMMIEIRDKSGAALVAPHDIKLNLASSSVPSSFSLDGVTWGIKEITIIAGKSTAEFYYRDPQRGTATVSATDEYGTAASQAAEVSSRYLLMVTGVSDPIKAGVPSSVTVQAVDWMGNIITDYVGTIRFSSSDPFATLPGEFVIDNTMNGRYTFINGVTMINQGEQCVSVIDRSVAETAGMQCAITVEEGNTSNPTKLAIITEQQMAPVGVATREITLQMQDEEGEATPAPVDYAVYIDSSSTTGSLSTDGITWKSAREFVGTIKKDTSSINLFYKDSQKGEPTLSFRDQAGTTDTALTDVAQQVLIGVGPPVALTVKAVDVAPFGIPQTVSVGLIDEFGQVTNNRSSGPIEINITSNNPSVTLSGDRLSEGAVTYKAYIQPGSTRVILYVKSNEVTQATLTLNDAEATLTSTQKNMMFVTPNPSKISLTTAGAVVAGEPLAVTVSIFDALGAPSVSETDTTVSLSFETGAGEYSLLSSPFTPTKSMIIPAGETSKTFYMRSNVSGSKTLRATTSFSDAHTVANTGVKVAPADVYRFSFVSLADRLSVDNPAPVTVQLYDIFGNISPAKNDTEVYLSSNSSAGSFATDITSATWTSIISTIIPAGSTTAKVYYKDTIFDHSVEITVSDVSPTDSPDEGVINAVRQTFIGGNYVSKIAFTSPPREVVAGEISEAVSIEIRQADGRPAIADEDMRISFLSSSPTGSFRLTRDLGAPVVGSAIIPKGQSQAVVYYSDTRAGDWSIEASAPSGARLSQAIKVSPSSANQLTFTSQPQHVVQNTPSAAIRLVIADRFGNKTIPTSDALVQWSSTCADSSFSEDDTLWAQIEDIAYASDNTTGLTAYFKSSHLGECSIAAQADGLIEATQVITLQKGVHAFVATMPGTLEAGQKTAVKIDLHDDDGNIVAAPRSLVVRLSASAGTLNNSWAEIPAGGRSATVGYTAPVETGSVTIKVFDEGSVDQADVGVINDEIGAVVGHGAPASVVFQPAVRDTTANTPVPMQIRLLNSSGVPTPAPEDQTLQLSHSGSGTLTVAGDVEDMSAITQTTILKGNTTATVYYRQTETGEAVIMASSDGLGASQGTVRVNALQISQLKFDRKPNQGEVGQSLNYSIKALDQFGNVARFPAGYTVYISTNGFGQVTGMNYNSNTKSIQAPDLTDRLSFSYKTTQPEDGVTFIVSEVMPPDDPDQAPMNDVAKLAVNWGDPASISLSSGFGEIIRGDTSKPVVIRLLNASGAVVPTGAGRQVTLKSNSLSGQFSHSPNGPWVNSLSLSFTDGTTEMAVYYHDLERVGDFTVNATSAGFETKWAYGRIVAGTASELVFVSPAQNIVATHPSAPIIIETRNEFGQPAPPADGSLLEMHTSSETGTFAQKIPDWDIFQIAWPKGATRVSVQYRDGSVGTHTLKIAMDNLRIPGGGTQRQEIEQSISIRKQILSKFLVTNISDPQTTNNPASVVVVAQDEGGYAIASYAGTIRFLTTDPLGTVPVEYTFRPEIDKGQRTFVNGVRFMTPGEHTVTAVDITGMISGAQTAITVIDTNEDDIPMTEDVMIDSNPDTTEPEVPVIEFPEVSNDEDSGLSDQLADGVNDSKQVNRTQDNKNLVDRGGLLGGVGLFDIQGSFAAISSFASDFTNMIVGNLKQSRVGWIGWLLVLILCFWDFYHELRHVAVFRRVARRLKRQNIPVRQRPDGVKSPAQARRLYLHPLFWMPVFIAITLTLLLSQAVLWANFVGWLLFVAILATCLIYSWRRNRYLKKENERVESSIT